MISGQIRQTDKISAIEYLERRRCKGEVATGMLYLEKGGRDFLALNKMVADPVYAAPNPPDGKAILDQV